MKLLLVTFIILANCALIVPEPAEAGWVRHSELADSLARAGQYDSAAVMGALALQELKKESGVRDTTLANLLYRLGSYHFKLNDLASCEPLWREALEVRAELLEVHHPAVMESLRYLTVLYLMQGEYALAEPLSKRCLAAWEESAEPDTTYAVRTLINLGVLYMNQKRYTEAEEVYQRALVMVDAIADTDDAETRLSAALRVNLTNLYRHQEKYTEVERMLLDQIRTFEGTNQFDIVVTAYHNLAELYAEQKRFAESERYFKTAIKESESLYGKDVLSVAFHLTSLGNLYVQFGKPTEAGSVYQRALDIKRKTMGVADQSVANTLVMYSRCERDLGNTEHALALAEESFRIRHSNFVRNYWALSEEDALAYSQIMRRAADAYLLAFLDRSGWDSKKVQSAANIILSTKGQVSDGIFSRRRTLIGEDDPALVELTAHYRETARAVSKLYMRGPGRGDPAKFRNRMDSLGRVAKELEGQLALKSAAFRKSKERQDIRWPKVTALLPPDAVLIEYARIRCFNLMKYAFEEKYLALIMRADKEPVILGLGEASVIDSLVAEYQAVQRDMAQNWPATDDAQLDRSRIVYTSLYRRVLSPIEDFLSEAGLVLIAPDGALNLVSIGALHDESGVYFIERYPVHYLSAGRDLPKLQSRSKPGEGLLTIGDVDYDASLAMRAPGTGSELSVRKLTDSTGLSSGRVELWPLPYTRREIKRVSDIWNRTRQDQVYTLLGAAASEENFKKEAPGKRVIHCATHGFFGLGFGAQDDQALALSDDDIYHGGNPLLKSGLFFAGANLCGEGADSPDADDGFLTAWEVAGMNLDGTQWVVLSACESGLGEVHAGEGVYGLRRAFQMAGVRTVISSLWTVPDKRTASVMEQLYSSKETNLALMMQEMSRKQIKFLRERNLPDHPYTWGAFIALGDWLVE